MSTSATILLAVAVLGVGGAAVYFLTRKSGGSTSTQKKTADPLDAFMAGIGSGLSKGVGDWFGSGYNGQTGPWAQDGSTYGATDDALEAEAAAAY
jgi:hypothetical protein